MIRIQTRDSFPGVEPKIITFPGGERHVQLANAEGVIEEDFAIVVAGRDSVRITVDFRGSNDLIDMLLVVNALRNVYGNDGMEYLCSIPYLPYARQDRVANPGEAHSLQVLSQIIGLCNFNRVTVMDPHSDVSRALFPAGVLQVAEQHEILADIVSGMILEDDMKRVVLVPPDAGATKKISKCSKALGGLPILYAEKSRDTVTGQINGTRLVNPSVIQKDSILLVIDDICDGGRTFIDLATVIKADWDNKLLLYVTHGIFSKGINVFEGFYDGIMCPNVMNDSLKQQFQDLNNRVILK
jgi:ribose-phosphate pyrophosphokinase